MGCILDGLNKRHERHVGIGHITIDRIRWGRNTQEQLVAITALPIWYQLYHCCVSQC